MQSIENFEFRGEFAVYPYILHSLGHGKPTYKQPFVNNPQKLRGPTGRFDKGDVNIWNVLPELVGCLRFWYYIQNSHFHDHIRSFLASP